LSRKEEVRLKRYETILIASADLHDDEQQSVIARYSGIINDRKGTLVKVENWGKRKLAYAIKKQNRGIYVLFEYAGESSIVNELERNLKIDDKILKFMTVLIEKNLDPAELERQLAELKEKNENKDKVQPPKEPDATEPGPVETISDEKKEN
jgi:small subunit ribosomal protein S6